MSETNWWKDFFRGLAVDMWQLAVTPEQTHQEADLIQKVLHLLPPAELLDVPCGNGRLSIELASRGFALTGVDISEQFLREARRTSSMGGLAIDWQLREMRDIPWQARFKGAFCFGNSFGYLDDDGNWEFLRAVKHALAPGGRFVLDASSVAENVLPRIREHTEMDVGDIRFIEDNRYDHRAGRLETDYTFVRGNHTEHKYGSHRIYTYRELESLLRTAGFGDCQSFGSIGGEPFRFGAQGLYFTVTRP